MSLRRRSYEPGHSPKFMVVVDDTDECDRAVWFAARRASRTGARLLMLRVIDPEDRHQQWLGVADVMREEAEAAAREALDRAADRAMQASGIEPERVIREGDRADEIVKLIEEDEDITILVLAAGTGPEGPGPLVSTLAGRSSGTFPVPIAIVPGHLGEAEIDALS